MKRADDCQQLYAIGASGGHTPFDFRIGFFNDTPKITSEKELTIDRDILTEIILPPAAAKSLVLWLGNHVRGYEKKFGEIKLPVIPENQKTGSKAFPNETGMWT